MRHDEGEGRHRLDEIDGRGIDAVDDVHLAATIAFIRCAVSLMQVKFTSSTWPRAGFQWSA